jgi:pyruvate dehydrogenase E2 component (dihydrolipoamide acetyltransferase)
LSKEVVKVPDIGDYEGVDVIEVLVKVGDEISAEDPIVSLETDKATMEVPSPAAGKVLAVHVKEGGTVSEGDVLIDLESGSESSSNSADVKTQEQEDTSQKSSEESSKDNAEDTSSASSEEVVLVPDIGDYDSVDVIEVLVKAGDEINAEDPLISLETDKATMEVPSPSAGKVLAVMVKEGGKVSKGDAILKLAIAGSVSNAKKAVEKKVESEKVPEKKVEVIKEQEVAPEKPVAQADASSGEEVKAGLAHASPSVRRFARELGADVSNVSGSGPKGRITQEDVQKYIKGKMQSMGSGGGGAGLDLLPDPKVDFAQFGEVEVEKLSRINKISAANLHRNWVKIPHITLFDDADITEMDSFRKAGKQEALDKGVKLTPLAFIVKAVAKALVDFPRVNSSLATDGDNLVIKKYVHMGVAVDTPKGLMVPVIKDADKKGVYEIAKDIIDFATRARDGKLTSKDMQGGTFTISSLGGLGTTAFTPIVNMPEVAILGVSKSSQKPVYKDGSFVPRLMLPLSLSLDHRVVDGALGAKFLTAICANLTDLKRLIL